MTTLQQDALDIARQRVRRDLGDLSDLPEEVRNTLANIYYEFAQLSLELQSPYAFPATIALADDVVAGAKKFVKDAAHLKSSVENFPDIIRGIREVGRTGSPRGFAFVIAVFLYQFKYRIPDCLDKSALRLKIEKPFYASKVREIPNLWKMFCFEKV